MRCALINTTTSLVGNLIMADPDVDVVPIPYILVGIPDDSPVEIGWTYSNGEFSAPVQVAE